MDEIDSRLDQREEQIRAFKDITVETIQNKTHGGKRLKKNEQSFSQLGQLKLIYMHVFGVPEVEEGSSQKKIFEEVIHEKFPSVMKIVTTYAGNSINLMQKKCEQNHNIACHVEMV